MKLAQFLQLLHEKLVVVHRELIHPPEATALWLIIFFVIAPKNR
jgi:hypothetical protein